MTARRAALIAVFLLTVVIVRHASALDATPGAILANPDRFDGKAVTVRGTIANFRETISRRGNPYYTFDLSDGTGAIHVFSFGKAPCRSGPVIVEGTFARVKQVSGRTFYNEITATQVTCR